MFAAAQARILESCRLSRLAQAASNDLACCCQVGSRASAMSVASASGGSPARKRAVSLALVLSAAPARNAGASSNAAVNMTSVKTVDFGMLGLVIVGTGRP
jgi:hypothetical protein